MTNVEKKDGKKELFQRVKIVVSIRKAGADEETARIISELIERKLKEGMKTKDIRKEIIRLLQKRNTKAAGAYMGYRKQPQGP